MTTSIFDDPVVHAFPHRFREERFLQTDVETLSPVDFRINARIARQWCARGLRRMRAELAFMNASTRLLCTRSAVVHGPAPFFYGHTPNPHPLRMQRRAERLERFAGSRWQSRDTEYYSACGWDDYCGEIRDDAAREARALRAAIHTEEAR